VQIIQLRSTTVTEHLYIHYLNGLAISFWFLLFHPKN